MLRPLIFRNFLSKIFRKIKNVLRPLIFRNFLSKIFRKFKNVLRPLIENGKIRSKWTSRNKLRPSSPPLRGRASPRGEAYNKGRVFKFMRYATVRYGTGDARPRGEGLK